MNPNIPLAQHQFATHDAVPLDLCQERFKQFLVHRCGTIILPCEWLSVTDTVRSINTFGDTGQEQCAGSSVFKKEVIRSKLSSSFSYSYLCILLHITIISDQLSKSEK